MYELKKVEAPQEWRALHEIRRAVLFAPGRHGVAYDENHPSDRETGNQPYLLVLDGEPIGVARLDKRHPNAVVRLVAIRADRQGAGHGRELERLLADEARRAGAVNLLVNAAPEAVGFYRSAGWNDHDWDPSELTGLAAGAVQMRKKL